MASSDTNIDYEAHQVYNFFVNNNFHATLPWVEQCVNWFKRECNISYSQDYLNNSIYEQWLLADLRDMEISSLPQDILSFHKYILPGKYTLQVEYIKDSSQSSYSQLHQIRNISSHEIDSDDQNKNKLSSNRVLALYMCDGIQDVIGMEYKPIKSINKYLKPGIKVMICGPVVCRRGVLFLEEINIKILGGECEELIIKNANENILARSLNLPESSTPYNPLMSPYMTRNENDVLPNEDVDWMETVNFDQIESSIDTDINNLEDSNNLNNSVSLIPVVNSGKINENHLQLEDQILEYVDILENNFSIESDSSEQINQNLVVTDLNNSTILKSNEENSMQSHNSKIVDNEPFIYIKQLLEDNISSGKFIVKARIKTLIKKLTFVRKWSLECIIMDGSGCLQVLFDNSVLEKLIGYSAKQMLVLQHQMINHFYKDQVFQALEKMKNKLMSLNALFKIEFNETSVCATVINIRGIKHSHLKKLQYRLNQ